MAGSNREEYLHRVAEANDKSDKTRISELVGETVSHPGHLAFLGGGTGRGCRASDQRLPNSGSVLIMILVAWLLFEGISVFGLALPSSHTGFVCSK